MPSARLTQVQDASCLALLRKCNHRAIFFTQVVTRCTLGVNEHSARNRGGYPNIACLRTEQIIAAYPSAISRIGRRRGVATDHSGRTTTTRTEQAAGRNAGAAAPQSKCFFANEVERFFGVISRATPQFWALYRSLPPD